MLQLFETVLILSAVGAILTLGLLLLKPVTIRLFGNRWQYYMWICVLVLIVLPPITIWLPEKSVIPAAPLPYIELENPQVITDILPTPTAYEDTPSYTKLRFIPSYTFNLSTLLFIIWLAGAVLFLLKIILNYAQFLRIISHHSLPVKCPLLDEVKAEHKITGNIPVLITPFFDIPFISGLFRPKLILPNTDVSDEILRHILRHELTHYKRHDLWFKWLSMLANAIHWFNPLIYLAVRQMNEECEISCDLAVVRNMDKEERKSYMNTILFMIAQNKIPPIMVSAMANSKKQIRRRFNMISREKPISKIMSAAAYIIAAAIVSTTLFTCNALAENTKNGLETWTKNEFYLQDGIQFSVNVSGKNVPAWVFEDIAGQDGNINVTVKRWQIRDLKGEVEDYAIVELQGAKGITRLSNISATSFRAIDKNSGSMQRIPELLNDVYTSNYSFCEFNNIGYEGYRNSAVADLVTKNSGKHKYVKVDFAFNKNAALSAVYVDFLVANEFDNVDVSVELKYAPVKADPDSLKFIGNFEKDYVFWAKELTLPRYFTFWEDSFVNKRVPGIDISVDYANTEGIALSTSVSHPQVSSYEINVYDQYNRLISSARDKKAPVGCITLKPNPIIYLYGKDTGKGAPEKQFVSGQTYRIDIVLFGKENKVVYRQRENVKLP